MRITCPTCETSYNLADGAMRASGRKVRCARCGETWFARPEVPPPTEQEAEAEWSAVEAEHPPEPPGPTEDDWRAALTDDAPRRKISGGPLPFDEEPVAATGDDTAVDEATEVDASEAVADRPEAGVPPGANGTDDGAGDLLLAATAVEADTAEKDGDTPGGGDAVPPTIDAEPPGFSVRRRAARKPTPKRAAGKGGRIGARILSGLVLGFAVITVAGLLAGSLFARDAVVRRFPDLAGLYGLVGLDVNLRGLTFSGLRTYRDVDEATPVLVVEGVIDNVSERTRAVPKLRFGLRSTSGREVYAWTMDPPVESLDPGETRAFKSRLPTPPEAAIDVQVRFTDRRGP